jgi:hypothetical protein
LAIAPTLLIEQAIGAAEQVELERLHKQAVPLGALGQIVAVGNGWKDAPTSYCNPYEGILQKQEARRIVPHQAARLFLQLLQEKRVPGWVVSAIDLELVRNAAE